MWSFIIETFLSLVDIAQVSVSLNQLGMTRRWFYLLSNEGTNGIELHTYNSVTAYLDFVRGGFPSYSCKRKQSG